MLTQRKLSRRAQAGFSLIEAMISMAVMTVGILGLAASHIGASRVDGQGLHITRANALAQSVGNALKMVPWESPALTSAAADNDADPDDQAKLFRTKAPTIKADHQLQLATVTTSDYAQDLIPPGDLLSFRVEDGLDYNGDDRPDFEIYWNVTNCRYETKTVPWEKFCEGILDLDAEFRTIGIIVRWQGAGGDWYQVNSQFHRYNPNISGT